MRLSSYLRPERASLAKMLLVIAAVTGINLLALPVIGYRSASILYLLAVIGLAFFTNRIAVLIAAGLSALLWDFFFLPPRFTFLITKLEDVLMFFLYFVTAAALAYPHVAPARPTSGCSPCGRAGCPCSWTSPRRSPCTTRLADIVHTGLAVYLPLHGGRELIVFLQRRDRRPGEDRAAR